MPSAYLDTLTLLAAVSGRFDPLALLDKAPEPERSRLAGALAELCDEDLSSGAYRWILKPAVRRAALSRLTMGDLLAPIIAAAPPLDEGDLFGTMLRETLRGKSSRLGAVPAKEGKIGDPRHQREDEARYAASQFARFTPAVAQERVTVELGEVASRISMRQRLASLAMVLPDRLFGRMALTRRLRRHVLGDAATAQPLLVSGDGGFGKSALLADLVRRWMCSTKPPFVVLLDFDRPTLAGGRLVDIMREVLRQLAAEYLRAGHAPSDMHTRAADGLEALRSTLRDRFDQRTATDSVHADKELGLLQQLIFIQIGSFVPSPLRSEPIALVMDSFETVGNLGPETVSAIFELEEQLRQPWVFPGLRSVVSGRGVPLPEAPAVARFGSKKRWVKVGPLTPGPAAALLEQRDRTHNPAAPRFPQQDQRLRAAKAMRGHPLALIVLERFARQRSHREIEDLLGDIEADPDFSAEFAQSFLYSRILDRIADENIQKLAHPGLILRRVSADLIRTVLAEPCLGRRVTPEEAKGLWEALSLHYWLVEPTGEDGVLRHRPDLRRLMLRQLFAGPRATDSEDSKRRKDELRHAAQQVSVAARRFYSEEPDGAALPFWTRLTPAQRRVEAMYHHALTGGEIPDPFPNDLALAMRALLGDDMNDLPVAWRGTIKATLGDVERLSDSELQSLTGTLRNRAFSALSRRNLSRGFSTAAAQQDAQEVAVPSEAVPPPAQRLGSPSSIDLDRLDRQVLSAFDVIDFDTVRHAGSILLRSFAEEGRTAEDTARKVADGRLWETGLWKAALCWGIQPWARQTRSLASQLKKRKSMGWHSDGHPTYFLIASLLAGVDVGRRTDLHLLDWLPHRNLQSLDSIRAFAGLLSADRAVITRWERRAHFTPSGLSLAGAWVKEAAEELSSNAPRRNIFGIYSEELRTFFMDLCSGNGFTMASLEYAYRTGGTMSAESPDGAPLTMAETKQLLSILRGLTPELYAPLAGCIAGSRDIARALTDHLRNTSTFWPEDLRFGASPAGAWERDYSKHSDYSIVETADRCGVLGTLCEFLAEHDPRVSALGDLVNLISKRLFGPKKT
ncbi:hypothetical protein [Azospirillum sp. B2RO_4]|uniref:hypothetical protein n=1 Tax=Azospirillum sp. B2RO_4 TaxID=3027796 RepID=UPI003DA7AAEC